MKTEIKKIDNTKRELSIEVSGDIVKNKFEEVFNTIAKEAKVPGFRLGHAPRDILEKHYSSQAHERVLKELVPNLYKETVEKEALDCLELPQISEVKLDRNSLSFKATVEVSPEIAIKNYKGQKVHYKKVSVSPDEIKHYIDALKESRGVDTLDDSFARSMGYPNLVELEKAVQRQVFFQKENQERQKIENEILQNLTENLNFKIPQSLLERQLQDLLRQAKVDLSLKGLSATQIEAQERELIKSLEPEAKRQVKIFLVLTQIAKKEKIPQDGNMPRRTMEFLLKEADWTEAS